VRDVVHKQLTSFFLFITPGLRYEKKGPKKREKTHPPLFKVTFRLTTDCRAIDNARRKSRRLRQTRASWGRRSNHQRNPLKSANLPEK